MNVEGGEGRQEGGSVARKKVSVGQERSVCRAAAGGTPGKEGKN